MAVTAVHAQIIDTFQQSSIIMPLHYCSRNYRRLDVSSAKSQNSRRKLQIWIKLTLTYSQLIV